MARRENPVDPTTGPLARLASDLRALRRDAGLTYRQMAMRCELVASTLSQAANGRDLPSWTTVSAYVYACGGKPASWKDLYEQARTASNIDPVEQEPAQSASLVDSTARRFAGAGSVPDPRNATGPGEFVEALKLVRIWAGQPSLREISARAGHRLPHTTLFSMLARQTLPRWDPTVTFLRACGIEEEDIAAWGTTWNRLVRSPPRVPSTGGLQTKPC